MKKVWGWSCGGVEEEWRVEEEWGVGGEPVAVRKRMRARKEKRM